VALEYIRAMCYDLTGQQYVLNSRHTDCTDFGHRTEKICVRGQQCTWQWNSYKHFDITRQKNVGGGQLARVEVGAWLGNRGQNWTSMKNICVGVRVMGAFGGDCSLEGGG
jgi:hypothetical protein